MQTQRAVLYLRSSKDRHDVAIEVQRRELTELARSRGYAVAGEFADVVESGKDEDRPGLQALLAELYSRGRTWSTVLALDTSRIARRAAAAYWFEDRECRPRGVSVVYKNLPDMEDAERAIVKAVFHGVDEWHSLVSKRKGLAGMRENVRSGFRAGGRPPAGYQLEHVATGAVRDGSPVLKSRLVVDADAPRVRAFLRDRAAGVARAAAARRHGLDWPNTTLLGLERNARTYAGHTVWNRLKEKGTIGAKYRPTADWEIRRDTHEALITDDQAAAIAAQLEQRKRKTTHHGKRTYLLGGLLRAPDGRLWHGDGDRYSKFYRHGKACRILARRVDQTVVDTLSEDLAGGRLAAALLERMRARLLMRADRRRIAGARRHVEQLEAKIRRLTELAAGAETPAPLLRTVAELEKEREAAALELTQLEREAATEKSLRAIDEDQVRLALRGMAVDLAGAKDDDGLRGMILQLLERVELDPAAPADVVLHYRLQAVPGFTGVSMASPQRHDEYPGGFLERRVQLAA